MAEPRHQLLEARARGRRERAARVPLIVEMQARQAHRQARLVPDRPEVRSPQASRSMVSRRSPASPPQRRSAKVARDVPCSYLVWRGQDESSGHMFERFTDRARRVVVLAQEEARRLNHNYIGTEHLLLGLIREDQDVDAGIAAWVLEPLGIRLEAVRPRIEDMIGLGRHEPAEQIPFTPRATRVLELALREASDLHNESVDTAHLLLGLIRERDGVAAQVLVEFGADLKRVRQQVIQLAQAR
jgi:hypothetical protein